MALNATQIRDGVTWVTNKEPAEPEADESPWVWFWQAVQGDFNDERSTSQIMTDAALSMIPGVDQICDVRDLIANCKKLCSDPKDQWAWVALALTLIGLFPSLGSLLKGVLKIFFLFIRQSGGDGIAKAVEQAMTWVVAFLRRREVQKYLGKLQIDEVFTWLARQVDELRGRINVRALLAAFDTGIRVVEALANKVAIVPKIGDAAKAALREVKKVRTLADDELADALTPVIRVMKEISLALEKKIIYQRHAILDAGHVHWRGTLPEAAAEALMRTATPRPGWLSPGSSGKWSQAKPSKFRSDVDGAVSDGWPNLSDSNIASFHTLAAIELKGPARLYRVVSPNSRAMGDCWVSEEVFNKIQSSPNPREAWRKYLAVWPDWNANGQFVMYDIKAGESLKAWSGPASSQYKAGLPNDHLEGGWDQLVFKVDRASPSNDTMRYYQIGGKNSDTLLGEINQAQFDALTPAQKAQYVSIREQVNHPAISGPYETGWGYTDFGGANLPARIGLPTLRGQITNESK